MFPQPRALYFLILIFCILQASYLCLLRTNYLNVLGNKYTLFYIMFWTEQKYAREILCKKKLYCLISVFSWFVIILSCAIFKCHYEWCVDGEEWVWYSRRICTDIMILSLMNYYQEHALPMGNEPCWLHKDVKATRGTVILCFYRFSNLYEILICGPEFCHCFCEVEKMSAMHVSPYLRQGSPRWYIMIPLDDSRNRWWESIKIIESNWLKTNKWLWTALVSQPMPLGPPFMCPHFLSFAGHFTVYWFVKLSM
jgi:hypothetical protein